MSEPKAFRALILGIVLGGLILAADARGVTPVQFRIASTNAIGSFPRSLTLADLKGRGILDVVTANFGSDSVGILSGNGDGTFATATNIPLTFLSPRCMALADFDGNQTLDLGLAGSNFEPLLAVAGLGDGTFGPQTNYFGSPFEIRSATAGDVTGDGRPDLVCAATGNRALEVFTNDLSSGAFSSAGIFQLPFSPVTVTLADVNNDQRLDAIAACNDEFSSFTNSVTVLIGDAANIFKPPVSYNIASGGVFFPSFRMCGNRRIQWRWQVGRYLRRQRGGFKSGRSHE